MIVDSFAKNIDTLNRLNVARLHLHYNEKLLRLAV